MRYQREDQKYDLFDIHKDKSYLILVFISISVCERKGLHIVTILLS